MENFKNNFYPKKDGREVISNIFPTEGRSAFSKKVEETFDWSEKGGPRVGTPLFINNVVGRINLTPEDRTILNREIKKEIKKIKKRKASSIENSNQKTPEQQKNYEKISEDAEKDLKQELKRSGGIDPNEI
jgi:hypothetical protein